jgi:hypothetical protein
MFNHPHVVFTEEMLRPELQDAGVFADGMDNIVATQRRVAEHYFADGSIAAACPPLRALLHIMREDHHGGKGLEHPEIRALFTSESMLASDWYAARLKTRQKVEADLWQRHVRYLRGFLTKKSYADEAARLGIAGRLALAERNLSAARQPAHLKRLRGTLGTDPSAVAVTTKRGSQRSPVNLVAGNKRFKGARRRLPAIATRRNDSRNR